MKKYWQVFKISFAQEFVYRVNFIMWRVRNVMQVFLIFFLWDTVFADPSKVVFGYDRAKMLTYVFGLLIARSIVTSAKSMDVAGDVSSGRLTNYLIRPVSYIKYWFTRDVSSKALNLIFACIEFTLLFLLLKPPFYFQANVVYLIFFVISLSLAVILFFLLMFLFNMFSLWYPEQAWGPTFLLMIFVEFVGGGIFPLDVLPGPVVRFLNYTPFPHLLFGPLQVYLGQVTTGDALRNILISFGWVLILAFGLKNIWRAGLREYRSEGR